MIDLILCLLLFFIQLCLFLFFGGYWNIIRTKMAALIAWLVGSITGGKGAEEPSEENKQSGETSKPKVKTETKQNKGRVRQRAKKTNEEPTFNTKLLTPIEDIIEETLSEEKAEIQSSSQATSEFAVTEKTKSKRKKKPLKKEKSQNKSDEEDTGASLLKSHPDHSESKQSLEVHIETKVADTTSVDYVGFSFFPVKKRIQKGKGKSEGKPLLEKQNSEEALTAVIAQGIAKRSDLSKPSIIDHYKNINVHVKKGDNPQVTENTQSLVLVNKVETNVVKADFKESKKVSSHISYASVVTNSLPDLYSEEEKFQQITPNDIAEVQDKLSKEVSSSIEVLSQCSEDPEINSELNQEVAEAAVLPQSDTFPKESNFSKNLEKSKQLKQSGHTCESVLEGSTEVGRNLIGDEQKNKELNLHFDENILGRVIKTVSDSEHNQDYSYNQNHFEDHQSLEIENINTEQTHEEKWVNSHDFIENITEGFNDQAINDIIEQLDHNKAGNIGEDTKAQQDIKNINTFLIEESRDYLEVNFSSQKTGRKTGPILFKLPEKFEELSASDLKDSDHLETNPEIEDFAAKKIIVSNHSEQSETSTKIFASTSHNGSLKELIEGEVTTAKHHLKGSNLLSSDDKLISNIVENFISAEIQQEVSLKSDLEIQQEVQEIVSVEQLYPQQESKQKPVEEEPFVKEGAYVITDDQTKKDTSSLVTRNLDQSTEKSFGIDEIKVSDTVTKENQSASILFVNSTDQDQTQIVKLGEDLETLSFEESKAIIKDTLIKHNQEEEYIVEPEILDNNSKKQINSIEEQFVDKQFTEKEVQKDCDIYKQDVSLAWNQAHTSLEQQDTNYNPSIEESLFANMSQIRVLTLNDREHQEATIYRIEKNFILQFRLGPSLLGRKIMLYSNYPKETNGIINSFDRGTYQLLSWCQDEGCKNADDTALYTQITAKVSGSFHYYFIYENSDSEERQGSGYFIVDPVLRYGNNEDLPLDCIQCQTVLAKQLGPFSTWENKLNVSKNSGYNMVHFTPIQELGVSKSSYSLSGQLKLNPMFNEENGKKPSFDDVEKLTAKMRKEWKVLSICDIVLNHTANESEWIKEHPEATYNCVNCPYLRPAYLLDAAFDLFSVDVKKGHYEDRGIPAEVSTEEHLNAIRYHFNTSVLEPLKLQELFTVDVNKHLEIFLTLARKTPPIGEYERKSLGDIKVIQDPEFRRLESKIDMDLALNVFNIYRLDCFDEESRVKRCAEDLKNRLDSLNEVIIKEVSDDLNSAVDNVIAGIRYFRVQADGPKFNDISTSHPLVYRYFTDYGSPKTLKEYEDIMYSENGQYLMAHNGWVMNSDPLKNFAAPGTKIYIRRELIAWGDSVKLRYGDKPDDSPFLWNYMRKYVEQTAKIFDGVRLDNCHSTPIPVAEYLLDAARTVRPDLYVVAELFTNSDLTDNIFVNRLGITSLIREAMSAWDSHEEGRLVYRYGGVPVGSFFQPSVRPLVPMVAHALFLDLTHDNPSPVEKRSVFDLLPSTALVNMACCASGSSRGYDELVPHHIHVVDETRQYSEWSDDESLVTGNVRFTNEKFGIIAAKKALNELHFKLGKEGYNQVYVDQMDPDIVAVTRHNPETHTSYVLIAFTAFGHPDIHAGDHQRGIKPFRVEGILDEIVLEASLSHIEVKSGGSRFTKFEGFTKDSTWINGLSEYQVSLKEHIQVTQSDIFEEANSGSDNVFQLNFKNFKPGSIAVVKVSLPEYMKESVSKVRSLIDSFSAQKDSELKQIISRMSLADLNRALYRCDQEERDEGNGFDVYNIPNFGPIVYCGLQGFLSLLANIRPSNDLGHPFCANLRDGNWLIEYVWKRLKVDEGTKELGQWIEENTKYLHRIPRYLIPCYFDVIVTGIYVNLLEQSYNLMSDLVKCGSTFVRSLSLGSLQFGGYVRSADLPVLSPNLAPPKPPTRKNQNGETVQACVTLSAGLPHFSVGYTRNWGRDTFIALRGLFILTGRFEEARQHILGYAACLRHGLIPNLLDGGRNSRYNCRDAIWWWLYCIKSYCEEAPNGTAILSDKVSRIFPTDDSAPQPPGVVDQPLHDVIQEGLKVHFQGLKFRERHAGRQIDEHMTDAGFNNQIGIHPETGFVFGGNQWNCGTWMDKMGSSEKAGNRGKPATPRDGSAVELVGLSKAAVSWLWKLNREGIYPYDSVERTHKNGAITKWTLKEWSDKIQENFEKKFWIGLKSSNDESRPDLINKKNIYKDSFGASQLWTDFQLRSNFPIAMVAAPELFNPQHAWAALEQTEKYLLGPLGMKTLDPEDWNYRGDYDNSNDTNDFNTAHGFNYHQGPEWVWPVGFFLRAKLIFAAQNGMLKETLASTKVILSKHFTELQTSPWRGLPELTNSNGSYCRDSSRTQAWSMSCILEVLYDLQQIESKQIIVN